MLQQQARQIHGAARRVSRRCFPSRGVEDTIGGVGRPQALINEDLKQCDYAVFVLHDRWGTPSGNGYTSGTEEEWALAEQLYDAKTIRNIMLFFKAVDPRQLRDPGPQLSPVLAFKKRIEDGKRYLFRPYATIDQFSDFLDAHLARWLNDHDASPSQISLTGLAAPPVAANTAAEPPAPVDPPTFDYWIAESKERLELAVPDLGGALFCAQKAEETAASDLQWAKARNHSGIALFLSANRTRQPAYSKRSRNAFPVPSILITATGRRGRSSTRG